MPRDNTLADLIVQAAALTGGISRQPAHLRHTNQLEAATNVFGRVGDGLSPRAGTRFLNTVSGYSFPVNVRIHPIVRDATERYLALYDGPTVRVFDTAGTEITVFTSDAAEAYLAESSAAADDMRLVTIADFTFILNTLVAVAAKTSDSYAVAATHEDYDVLLSQQPSAGTYHHAKNDTEAQPAGYWKYLPVSGDNGFAKWQGPNVSGTGFNEHNNTWDQGDWNPMGFKVTFRDRNAVDHEYNVVENFFESPATSMNDIALRFQRKLQAAGATDAMIYWTHTNTRAGYFTIVAPYRGTGAAVQAIAAPTGARDISAGSTPFDYSAGTATAGTGDPATQTQDVLTRWQRVPAPAQANAELDEATMPVQMRRLKAPYYRTQVMADSPVHYWRLGETSGTAIVNEVVATTGTYTVAGSGNHSVASLVAGDTDKSKEFLYNGGGNRVQYGNLGTLGTLGNDLDSGVTFEFWLNTTTSVTPAVLLGQNAAATNQFYIQLNPVSVNGEIGVHVQEDASNVLSGRTAAVNLRDGNTHHVVIYVNASTDTIRIWIDNVERTVTYDFQQTPNMANFSAALYLGAVNTGAGAGSGGLVKMDEVAIYNALLTTEQINRHYKYGSAATVFDIDVVDWGFRQTGDDDTNPVPSIWQDGDKLADIGFHRNRLVLAGDENIVFSQAGSFFDFYLANSSNIADSDPIDVALSAAEVTLADFIVPFNKALVVFTKAGRQFELNAPEALTPTTAAITPSTRYESLAVRPKPLGTFIYFVAKRKNATILYEYFYDDSRVSNTAADVTAHVHDLLPTSIRTVDVSANNNAVLVLPTQDSAGISTFYHYNFFYSANRKEQSAWHKAVFTAGGGNVRIADVAVIENDLYFLNYYPVTGTVTLEAMSLSRESPDSSWIYPVHLDCRKLVTGVHAAGTTTFTLPIGDSEMTRIVLGPAFGADNGKVLTVTPVGPGYTTATISGDYSAGQVAIGRPFTASAELTRPFIRNSAAQVEGPQIVSGRLTAHHLTTYHDETGEYKVRVSQPDRTDRSRTFTAASNGLGTGTMRQWVKGKADDARVFIENTGPRPFIITAAEWLVEFKPTHR